MLYFDYIKMTYIPNEIVNHIIGYARPPKPKYIYHFENICKIVTISEKLGLGNCRVIDYVANERNIDRLNKLKRHIHYSFLSQLKHLIITYNDFIERDTDSTYIGLGEWYKWWIYEDVFYTSGDENYESDESYSSEDDDNNDY